MDPNILHIYTTVDNNNLNITENNNIGIKNCEKDYEMCNNNCNLFSVQWCEKECFIKLLLCKNNIIKNKK